MSSTLRAEALVWLAAARKAIVVEVAEARGSVPRAVETRMLVAADACAGTIGGGHLELQAITHARALLARRSAADVAGADTTGAVERRHYSLGPSLGQCCGGAVTLSFRNLDDAALAAWPDSKPLFDLQLHGAGHVGRAIATLLATLDCHVAWYDQRDDGFPATTRLGSPWPAHIERIAIDTVEAEVAAAPAGAFYLVLTHEHALDLRIAETILRRGDFGFFGLIGSKTKRASFASRLIARGIEPADIERMTCPIGIAGLSGKAPEIIAAGAVAQLLQEAERLHARPVPSLSRA